MNLLPFLLIALPNGPTMPMSDALDFPNLPTVSFGLPNGTGVERTVHLLQTSTAQKPNRVKILFYGQSISVESQAWTQIVKKGLQETYPNAQIEFQNLAIGGFAANLLKWTAIDDIKAFSPDLTILQDYGGEPDYQDLVDNLMRNSHSELLMQSDHVSSIPAKPAEDRGFVWHNLHTKWLRDVADKSSHGLVDIRYIWYRHLVENNVNPAVLMSDGIHPNEAGGKIIARPILEYLKPKNITKRAIEKTEAQVKTITVKPADWKNGEIRIPFEGYRLELLSEKPLKSPLDIQLGKRKPSEIPSLYYNTRATNGHNLWFSILTHINTGASPREDSWTLKISDAKSPSDFNFEVSGAKSGPQGKGSTRENYRAPSQVFELDKDRWIQNYGKDTPPNGMIIQWKTLLNGTDRIAEGSTRTLIASGLEQKPNLLILKASTTPEEILTITVYKTTYPATKR